MRKWLRHLLTPHESNNHRSRVLHHDSLLLVVALLIAALLVIQGEKKQYPGVLGDATASINVQDLLKDTNADREANGLGPLVLNPELTQAAQMKAQDMFAKDYWAHVSPDGTTPWVWIRKAGYNYLYAGENLARGFDSSDAVVTAWMNSPEHRANLLSANYTDIGFAVQTGSLTGSETTLVVQEFGSPYNPDGTVSDTSSVTITPEPATVAGATGNQSTPSAKVVGGNIQIGQPSAFAGQAATPVQPVIDANALKRSIAFGLLGFFVLIFAIDAIVVERKQIQRAFSHNTDHMLFLLFILLAGIIIGTGVIL